MVESDLGAMATYRASFNELLLAGELEQVASGIAMADRATSAAMRPMTPPAQCHRRSASTALVRYVLRAACSIVRSGVTGIVAHL